MAYIRDLQYTVSAVEGSTVTLTPLLLTAPAIALTFPGGEAVPGDLVLNAGVRVRLQ